MSQTSTLKKVIRLGYILLSLLLVVVILWKWKNISSFFATKKKAQITVFSPNEKRLKVVILPFQNQCKSTNVADGISDYLSKLSNDSLSVIACYLSNYTGGNKTDSIKKIQLKNNADLVIYEKNKTQIEYLLKDSILKKYPVFSKIISHNQLNSPCDTSYTDILSALVYWKTADDVFNLKQYTKSLEFYERIEKQTDTIFPDLNNKMGDVFCKNKQFQKALLYLTKNVDFASKKQDSVLLINAFDRISLVYSAQKDFKTALNYGLKVQSIREKMLCSDHPDLATSYNNNAISYFYLKDIVNAKLLINKAVKIRKKIFPLEHPDLQNVLANRRFIYQSETKKIVEKVPQ